MKETETVRHFRCCLIAVLNKVHYKNLVYKKVWRIHYLCSNVESCFLHLKLNLVALSTMLLNDDNTKTDTESNRDNKWVFFSQLLGPSNAEQKITKTEK